MASAAPARSSHAADLDRMAIDTIRTLSMDAVEAAKSGHPGTPMALAPVAYTVWRDFLRYDPANPHWANRDRFVLSCGHASMLLYSLIHLSGIRRAGTNDAGRDVPAVSFASATCSIRQPSPSNLRATFSVKARCVSPSIVIELSS